MADSAFTNAGLTMARGGAARNSFIEVRYSPKVDAAMQELERLGKDAPAAIASAINRTLTSLRSFAAAEIRQELLLKRKAIIERMEIRRASQTTLAGKLSIQGRRLSIINFNARASKRGGVKVQVYKSGEPFVFRHGFIGIGLNNARLVFLRKYRAPKYRVGDKAHHKPNVGRLMERLQTVYGPSLWAVLKQRPTLDERIVEKMGDVFVKNAGHQLSRFSGVGVKLNG
jgi:hypothetical protein